MIIANCIILAVAILPLLSAWLQGDTTIDKREIAIDNYLLMVGGVFLVITAIIFVGGSSDPRSATSPQEGSPYVPFTKPDEISRLNKGTVKDMQKAIRHSLYTLPAAIILLISGMFL